MQYEVDGGNITVVVGDEARMNVGTAISYVQSGQAEINAAVDTRLAEFNENADNKTTAFNNNASGKTTDFNNNASDKTDAFNLNATNKTTAFNDNAALKQAAVDAKADAAAASATLAQEWAVKMDGKVADEDYSAKYYADLASQAAGATGANIDLSNLSPTGEAKFDAKQDVISDLATIRSGAALGDTSVQLSGAQTITGTKTFSNDFSVLANSIKISSTGTNCNYPLSFQLPSFTKGDTPANNVIAGIDFYGSARTNFSDRLSNIDFMVDTSKNSSIAIRAYDCSSSASFDAAGLSIHYDANGNTYALCPAPSLASNASNYSKQIVNISYLNGASSGVVHLTGNETITGTKTIKLSGLSVTFLDLVNSSITNGAQPSNNAHNRIYFSDKDAHATACIYNNFESNGENGIVLQALKSETVTPNLTRSFTQLGLYYPATGNPYATAPASDVNGSIVTTKSHGENYVEFGNGYILQKGTFTYASSSGTVDVPLDKTMTTTSYCVMICLLNETRANVGAVTARATNKFTYKSFNYESTGTAMYIVFGK